MHQGYYRYPTLHGDSVVFTCEDDMWQVSASGGVPRRLTAGAGERTHTHFSPDGKWIAFTGRDEGPAEVFVIPADGGEERRLTFLGATCFVVGWRPDGGAVYFATNAREPFSRQMSLWEVPLGGGAPTRLPWGPARHIAEEPNGKGLVIGRNTGDPARWKRYRGGTAGELWVDAAGDRKFQRLNVKVGNCTTPMWLGGRIYFIADPDGVGNLYSCLPDGADFKRHTDHDVYYARQATTDGTRIVYHAGADVFVFDPAKGESTLVPVQWHAPAPQRSRRFVDAAKYLDGVALSPDGQALAIATRGKAFTLGNWAGGAYQLGASHGVRYRHPAWLADGKRVLYVHDAAGDEQLAIGAADASGELEDLGAMDLGRVLSLAVSPHGDRAAIANHRHELILVDLVTKTAKVVDRSPTHAVTGMTWSPDGAWLAYARPLSRSLGAIFIADAATGEPRQVTEPVLHDLSPSWDPKGRWLCYVSYRYFDPVYDNLHFDLGFPRGGRPALVTLRPDVPSPFVPTRDGKLFGADEEKKDEDAEKQDEKKDKDEAPKPVVIDFDGIARRVVPFPVPEGRYEKILALPGKALFTSTEPVGALGREMIGDHGPAKKLEVYDFASGKRETLDESVEGVAIDAKGELMLLHGGDRLRVVAAGEKPKEGQENNREQGWIDLKRVRVDVVPKAEWRQMYREAWRLQRDNFWTENMSSVDWQRVHDAYLPLLERVASRAELSDLMWEIQGELGTSHAYEGGGDYRVVPRYDQGQLGAQFAWDGAAGGWTITEIVDGDPGDPLADSPLRRVGANLKVGDVITSVNGRKLSAVYPPEAALVHQARIEVALSLADGRMVEVKTIGNEGPARYREWVDANRKIVHTATGGKCGYVHIPDMGPIGYAEFHRGWFAESERESLIVDVRNNGGGHVSQLILEKLARRRLGYDVPRWGRPAPYPDHAMLGPIVAITNEIAGSDGDIFSHCFKLMKLGPLVGKRTWGGVIGIWPRHGLVDGSYTTQPEFSFWFHDVGWGVENYGTDPDIEIDMPPDAYAAGQDPQLDRALAEIAKAVAANPPAEPDLSVRPNLAAPKLPPR